MVPKKFRWKRGVGVIVVADSKLSGKVLPNSYMAAEFKTDADYNTVVVKKVKHVREWSFPEKVIGGKGNPCKVTGIGRNVGAITGIPSFNVKSIGE
jgi:hypothetical protein